MAHQAFTRIMTEYPSAKAQPFEGHALAEFIRHDVPTILESHFPQHSDLLWRASAGRGQWSDAPWIAVFDPLVTETPQEGYYPVYLFTRTLDAIYLSLNQGMTKLRQEFGGSQAKEILRSRANILRSRLVPDYQMRFGSSPIDLQAPTLSSRLAFYEPGHVFGIKYDRGALPTTLDLINDLASMIDLYRLATARGGTDDLEAVASVTSQAGADVASLTLQEKRQFRYHRVIERNRGLAKKAKQVHGYVCQVCGFDFETVYGSLGHEYIEAHHLTPISQLPLDKVVWLSPEDDFRVVCPNCHRMIHKKGAPSTFNGFVRLYNEQNAMRQRAT